MVSSSLSGNCSFALGQDGGSGVLGLGERHRVSLTGPGCGFVNNRAGGLNQYKINVSYTWESNRAVGGSIEGRLMSPGSSGPGGGICDASVAGVCGDTTDSCAAGTFRSLPNGWSCDGLRGGRNAACSAVNGICGSNFEECQAGNFRDVLDNTTHHLWTCKGLSGGTDADNCSMERTSLNPSDPLERFCGTGRDTCIGGVYTDVMDNTTHYLWKCGWSCDGTTGEMHNCSLSRSMNGICGTARDSCTVGFYDDFLDNKTHYLWECKGQVYGNNATCSASKPVNGVCSSVSETCVRGRFNDLTDTASSKLWNCEGMYGGKDVSCSSPLEVAGSCGSAKDTCSKGSYEGVLDNTSHVLWTCKGLYGGNDASCSLSGVVDGVCDVSVNNGCSSGSISDTPDNSTHNLWSCDGSGSGFSNSCSRKIKGAAVNGVCDVNYVNGCSSGVWVDRADHPGDGYGRKYLTGYEGYQDYCTSPVLEPYSDCRHFLPDYRWSCKGLNGGSSQDCKKGESYYDAVCGSSVNTCNSGSFEDVADTPEYQRWRCKRTHTVNYWGYGTINLHADCRKEKNVKGVCDNSGVVNDCISGKYRDVNDDNNYYKWSCDGLGGGTSDACSVRKGGRCDTRLNGCLNGTYREVADDSDDFKWECSVAGLGTESCSLKKPVNGACDVSAKTCLLGNHKSVSDNSSHHRWECNGLYGGSDVSCSSVKEVSVDGVCDNSVLGECSKGVYRDAADTNSQYKWKCDGLDGGRNASCTKSKSVNGVCDNSVLGECSKGVYRDAADTNSQYKWNCDGLYGGRSVSCSRTKVSNGICGVSKNVCEFGRGTGSFVDTPDTTRLFLWSCNSDSGGGSGLDCSCSACAPIDGGWSSYGACYPSSGKECGSGFKHRACTSPVPSCGGKGCSGSNRLSCVKGCSGGKVCSSGTCVDPCSSTTCSSGSCSVECGSGTATRTCYSTITNQLCSSTSVSCNPSCPSGKTCSDNKCVTPPSSPPPSSCNRATSECRLWTGECGLKYRYSCRDGKRVRNSCGYVSCPSGTYCFDGDCCPGTGCS